MANFWELAGNLLGFWEIFRTAVVVVLLLLIFNFFLHAVRKSLLKRAKTKKQISNIEIFSKIINYLILLVVALSAVFSYSGSWAGLGFTVGIISAAIGWALQKPITGIGAWLMIVLKRPFDIGDRVIIGNFKGDVVNITLTHIYIHEIGGIVEGEEKSGRLIIVPNSVMFEQNIVNYTFQNEYILDQVTFIVTYSSNLDEAIKIAMQSAKKHIGQFAEAAKKYPYTRTFFQPSGISVHVRYFSPAQRLQEFSSSITKEIIERIKKSKNIKLA